MKTSLQTEKLLFEFWAISPFETMFSKVICVRGSIWGKGKLIWSHKFYIIQKNIPFLLDINFVVKSFKYLPFGLCFGIVYHNLSFIMKYEKFINVSLISSALLNNNFIRSCVEMSDATQVEKRKRLKSATTARTDISM